MTDSIYAVYMTWIGAIISTVITGPKLWFLDDCPSHFNNPKLLQDMIDIFDIHLERGVKNMTQFWQPCDQFIIALMKRYIRDEIYKKIKEQEAELEKYIAKCGVPPTIAELETLKKEIQMPVQEFRVFITWAVGNAWTKLLKQDDVWIDSWLPSGLHYLSLDHMMRYGKQR